jgi:HEAT repeat protein
MIMKKVLLIALAVCFMTAFAGAQDLPDLDSAFDALPKYNFGEDRSALYVVEEALKNAHGSADLLPLEKRLIPMLSGDATVDAKRYICRLLRHSGSEAAVSALVALLKDAALAPAALWALENIPGQETCKALYITALNFDGLTQLGAIQALGRRGLIYSLPELLGDDDSAVAEAAALALGKVGGKDATAIVLKARKSATGVLLDCLNDAALACADSLGAAAAIPVYEDLIQAGNKEHVRSAALRGLVAAEPKQALDRVLAALSDSDADYAHVSLAFIAELPGAKATKAFAALLAGLESAKAAQLIEALQARGDDAALPQVTEAAQSADEAVRMSAVQALGDLGNAKTAALLVATAGEGGKLARAAKQSLNTLPGDQTNAKLLALANSGGEGDRVEAIDALGRRNAVETKAALLKLSDDSNNEVRKAAYKALRGLGDADDVSGLVAKLLAKAESDDREAIQSTIVAIAKRTVAEGAQSVPILQAQSAAKSTAKQTALLELLGQLPNAKGLDALRAALNDKNEAVVLTALAQLGGWPTSAPLGNLAQSMAKAASPAIGQTAFDSYTKLLRSAKDLAGPALADAYSVAVEHAATADAVKTVLAGLSRAAAPGAFDLITKCRAIGGVDTEADLAALKVAQLVWGAAPEQARAALQPFLPEAAPEHLRKMAHGILANMDGAGDFITAWELSGPHTLPHVPGQMLFDKELPPEAGNASVVWRIVPMADGPQNAWHLDLAKLIGGDERAAFLRSRVWSPKAQKAALLAGSNDGIKIYWNGSMVLGNNIGRGIGKDQEQVEVDLKEGWNSLMLGVYQMGGGWAACARVADLDGKPLAGLKFGVGE